MSRQLDAEDIRGAVTDVVARLDPETDARIRIVGGAALKLYFPNRRRTIDVDVEIDASSQAAAAITHAVTDVARERGWPEDWLNSAAAGFIPSIGAAVEWHTLLIAGRVTVEVITLDALLAMKLKAMERRGARDVGDVALLLQHCDISTPQDAEDLVGRFFPGDGLTPRCLEILSQLLTDPRLTTLSPPQDISRWDEGDRTL